MNRTAPELARGGAHTLCFAPPDDDARLPTRSRTYRVAAEDLDVYVVPLGMQSPRRHKRQPSSAGHETSRSSSVKDASGLAPADAEMTPDWTYVKSRIEVGLKPLILRESCSLDSQVLGQLPPGLLMMVLDEYRTAAGDVRAHVAPIDDAAARLKLLDSWHHPFLQYADDCETSSSVCGLPPSQPALPPPVGLQGLPVQQPAAECSSSATPGSKHQAFEEEPTRSPLRHPEPNTGSLSSEEMAGLLSPSRSLPLTSQRAPTHRHPNGWVTIVKNGEELVRRRERLDTVKRQQHLQQWARRQRTDKSAAAQKNDKKMEARYTRSKNPFEDELASDPEGICFAFGGVDPGTMHAHGQLHDVHRAHYSVGRVGKYLLHIGLRSQALPLPGSPFTLIVLPGSAHAQSTCISPALAMLSGRVGEGLDDGCRLSINASDKMGNLCIAGGAKVDCTCSNSSVQCKSRDNLDGSYTFEWRSKMSGFFYVHVLVENQSIQGSPIKMRLSSSIPDLSKTVLTGSGIGKHIPAGVPVEIHLSFLDQYSNGCSPGSKHEYAFGITILPERSGAKLSTATAHRSEGKWSSEDTGDFSITYSATKAGNCELYVWCDVEEKKDRKGGRIVLPGSPFMLHVQPGKANAEASEVEGFSVEGADKSVRMDGRPSSGLNAVTPPSADGAIADKRGKKDARAVSGLKRSVELSATVPSVVIAGDSVVIRPLLFDSFGNQAQLVTDSLTVQISSERTPGPHGPALVLKPIIRSGLIIYESRHETRKSGHFYFNVLLYGEPIKGSPVPFQVSPAVHDRNLTVVEGPKLHKLTADETYTCIVRLRDRFCNYLEKGGATVGARMVYSRQGMQDPNMLNQQNNFANVEDNQDGTYNVCFGLLAKGFSNWPLTASLVINCDKDTKDPQGFDVHSSTYQFNLAEEAAATHPDSDAQPRLHRRAR